MTKFISTRNLRFLIQDVFNVKMLTRYDYFSDHTEKMFDMVIDEALKLAVKLMYPYLEEMDQNQPEIVDAEIKVFIPLILKMLFSVRVAVVVISDKELPACGSVKAMVPCHFPESILGT